MEEHRVTLQEFRDCARKDAIVAGQHRELVVQVAFGLADGPPEIEVCGSDSLGQAVANFLQLEKENRLKINHFFFNVWGLCERKRMFFER